MMKLRVPPTSLLLRSPLSRTLSRAAVANHAAASMASSATTGRSFPVFRLATRSFSDDSHSDFAPKRTPVDDDDQEIQGMIQQHVQDNPIMLYMKGTPSTPMCGFSAQVVQTLQDEGVDFSSVNVLDYPALREGIKKFSDWPTIPQLYVNGEFIGGSDIVLSMHKEGELKDVLAEVTTKDA